LEYVNPPNCLLQDELFTEKDPSGNVNIYEKTIAIEKEAALCNNIAYNYNKVFTVTYFSHACVEITCGKIRIITDPWFIGPAFSRGWWLSVDPPEDCFERLVSTDYIYISHSHPDHLNFPTLERLSLLNPTVKILIPKLTKDVWTKEFKKLPFTNVKIIDTNTWIHLEEDDVRIMSIPDTLFPGLDTAIVIDYAGKRLLNLVDCCSPIIPKDVDVILTDFASGASGYPAVHQDMYSEDKIKEIVKNKARGFLVKQIDNIRSSNAKTWIPFAGSFVEAAPGDESIRTLNVKNTPEGASEYMKKQLPSLNVWLPFPGGKYDIINQIGDVSVFPLHTYDKKTWDFSPYLKEIEKNMLFESSQANIQAYFDWLGFRSYDMILHIIETTNDFNDTLNEYFIDFNCVAPKLIVGPPASTGRNLYRMRARASILRGVYKNKTSWDDLFIGFNCRVFVSPDIHHLKFLDYVSNKIPD
jgi:CMP-N-acetylneuraminate monooxygenase